MLWRNTAQELFFHVDCEPGKPIVRCAVGIFSIDQDQSSASALTSYLYLVSRYLEPSVRYHPLTSSPTEFEPAVFAFALAYIGYTAGIEPSQATDVPGKRDSGLLSDFVD